MKKKRIKIFCQIRKFLNFVKKKNLSSTLSIGVLLNNYGLRINTQISKCLSELGWILRAFVNEKSIKK